MVDSIALVRYSPIVRKAIAARIAMMPMTISNSIRVKPLRFVAMITNLSKKRAE